MAFTNVYSLLDLFRSVNSGWGMQIALDTTFDINDRQMNMLTCGVTALEGHYHPLLSAFIPGDSESFVMYRNSWKALSAAAHALIADLQLCVLQTCPICSVIRQIKEQPQFVPRPLLPSHFTRVRTHSSPTCRGPRSFRGPTRCVCRLELSASPRSLARTFTG